MKSFSTLRSYFSNKEIIRRLIVTLIILFIFRLLGKIPAPGIDVNALQNLFTGGQQNSFFNIANILAGGTLTQFSIISVGLFAFISASVIFQLLGPVVPKIEQLQKMGEVGKKIINQWTRVLTVPLAAFQSFGIYLLLKSNDYITPMPAFRIISLMFVLTAGTMLLIWLAEILSEQGLGGKQGGGVSVIITAGILASIPTSIAQAFSSISTSNFLQNFWATLGVEMVLFLIVMAFIVAMIYLGRLLLRARSLPVRVVNTLVYIVLLLLVPGFVLFVANIDTSFTQDVRTLWYTYTAKLENPEVRFGFFLGLTLQLIGMITFVNESFRRIPIKFISRIRTNAGKAVDTISYLPIKLLAPGVMPIIFASSLLLLPQVIYRFFGTQINNWNGRAGLFLQYASQGWLDQTSSSYYQILSFILIVLFSMFFITVIMRPEDIADNLKNMKTFIPGVRPGRETMEYLSGVIMRVTFWGGFILAIISTLPYLLGLNTTTQALGIETFIAGGTSILIVVPTILAVKMQLDALVLTKNYEQFEEI
jgi:preprotein translocase subunit SecY